MRACTHTAWNTRAVREQLHRGVGQWSFAKSKSVSFCVSRSGARTGGRKSKYSTISRHSITVDCSIENMYVTALLIYNNFGCEHFVLM